MKPFLTAEWRNLIILTYSVDPEMLEPYLCEGLIPDTIDNRAFVSLVAFDFLNTKVRGIYVPFHIHFPEINLRFYVRHNDHRGVVFIKELVPKYCIAKVARRLYNEPYESIKMTSTTKLEEEQLHIEHFFNYGEREHRIKFIAENSPFFPDSDGIESFFKEHEWGFGTDHQGRLSRYKVEHPVWKIYPLKKRFTLDVDFGLIYGNDWKFLNNRIPYSVVLAEGSHIKVFPGKII